MQHFSTVAAIKRQLTPTKSDMGPDRYPLTDRHRFPALSPPLDLPPVLNMESHGNPLATTQLNVKLPILDNRLPSPASPKVMAMATADDLSSSARPLSPPAFLEPAPQLDSCYTSSVFRPHLSLGDVSFRPRIIDRRATLPLLGEKPKYHHRASTAHRTSTLHIPIPRRQSSQQQNRPEEELHRSPPLIQPKASTAVTKDAQEEERKWAAQQPGPISPIMAAASATAAAVAIQRPPGSLIVETLINSLRLTKQKQQEKNDNDEPNDDDDEDEDENENDDDDGDGDSSPSRDLRKPTETHATASQPQHATSFTHVSFMVHGNKSRSLGVDHNMFLTKNAHIKRPRNAWIHFRCHYGQALKTQDPTLRADEISKRASHRWARLTEQEKKPWHEMADQEKLAHKEAFPEYRYCPKRSANSTAAIPSIASPPSRYNLTNGTYGLTRLPMEKDNLDQSDHSINGHRQKRAKRKSK
ncbi:hypothetical protein DFQ28_004747 [Apophysomyces sp. BC1034]|nr:hypothetical protein DFQ30_010604 [Apophysomyces sp. BC1015]KAG0180941.1 hypothetical protein DFQ29_009762 [Apophysomyces sp. BC1021]KAG0188512.1 hypothetical protein DFQ28_004747 [Apophysomyces sp. BC1034]